MNQSIHNSYQAQHNPVPIISPGAGYSARAFNRVSSSIHNVAGNNWQQPGAQHLGDRFDRRRTAMYQQMSYAGKLNPGQKKSYDDATKAKALGNFAELTDTQMEVAELKNWEIKIDRIINAAG
jgi:hypothetical protein